jgi:hypothetical protein
MDLEDRIDASCGGHVDALHVIGPKSRERASIAYKLAYDHVCKVGSTLKYRNTTPITTLRRVVCVTVTITVTATTLP